MQNVHVFLANLSGANLRGNRTEMGESRKTILIWHVTREEGVYENLEK